MRSEIKVGIFVFLGLISLIFLTLQVKSLQSLNQKGYTVYAVINDASGLSKKAKVKMRGVSIGTCTDMKLLDNGVKLKLLINKGVKIPEGSVVTLAQDNFLGGKYIKIIPSESMVYIKPNGVISKYLQNVSMDDVLANVNTAVDDIKVLINKLNTTLDQNTINNIKETVNNIKQSSVYLQSILKTTDSKIPVILNNTNTLILEYKKAGVTLNKKLPSILDKTDSVLSELNMTGKIINVKLDKLLDEYIRLGKNANNLLTDNKEGIKQAVASAKDFFVSGGESFKKIDDYLSSLSKSQIIVDIQSNYMQRDDYFKTSANIAYMPVPTKAYIFGVTSSKDYSNLKTVNLDHQEDKVYITAQYGKRFDDLMLRGGITENTGGLGFDYFFYHDKIKLTGDIYDFNAVNDVRGTNPHLSFKATYLYLKHLQLIGGVDNVLNKDAQTFFLGLGVKFKDNDLKTLIGGGASSFLK